MVNKYDFDKAINLWKHRLDLIMADEQVEYFGVKYTKLEKINYCEKKIWEVQKDKEIFLNLGK